MQFLKRIWLEVYDFGAWLLANGDARNGFIVGLVVGVIITKLAQWA